MFFTKSLNETDLESKLMVPNDLFREFSPTQGRCDRGGAVDVLVRDQNGQTWTFRLSSIGTESDRHNYKLVFSAGWLPFVRDKKLQRGDRLTLFKEGSNDRVYRVEVKRRVKNKGTTDSRESLV